MSLKKSIPILSVMMLMILILASPLCDGSTEKSVKCGDVSVMTFDGSVSMDINSSATLTFHITNYNSTVATVRIGMENNSDIELSSGPVTVPVGANTTLDKTITIQTHTESTHGSHPITIDIGVICSGKEYSDSMTVDVSISSKYASDGSYNKFFGTFDNNLPEPFNTPIFTAVVTIIGWIAIAVAASTLPVFIMNRVFRVLCEKDKMISRKTFYCLFIGIMLYALQNTLMVLGLKEDIIANVARPVSVIYVILGAYIFWDIYKVVVYYFLHAVDDGDDSVDAFDVTLIPLFNFIGKVLIVTVATGIALSILGVDLLAIITGAGLAGLGVSLGVKPAVNELLSGLAVVLTRPFKVGDMVVVGDNPALEVTKIGLLKTSFRTTYTNEYITMPNSTISASEIVNRTPNTRKYRTSVVVHVGKGTNLTLVRKLLKEAAMENDLVVKDSSAARPRVVITNYRGERGIELRLYVYVSDYGDHSKAGGLLREAIVKKFNENGIIIPFAQQDYYIYVPKD